MNFVIGEIVQLKSGGPIMTIETIDDDEVCCVWFLDGEVKRDCFGKSLLTKE